jgi:hypothetical protein
MAQARSDFGRRTTAARNGLHAERRNKIVVASCHGAVLIVQVKACLGTCEPALLRQPDGYRELGLSGAERDVLATQYMQSLRKEYGENAQAVIARIKRSNRAAN